jgi:hypothetical protein
MNQSSMNNSIPPLFLQTGLVTTSPACTVLQFAVATATYPLTPTLKMYDSACQAGWMLQYIRSNHWSAYYIYMMMCGTLITVAQTVCQADNC